MGPDTIVLILGTYHDLVGTLGHMSGERLIGGSSRIESV